MKVKTLATAQASAPPAAPAPAPAPAPAQAAPPPPPPPPPVAETKAPPPAPLPPPPPPPPTSQAVVPAVTQALTAPEDLPAYLADEVYKGDGVTPGFENVGASGLQLPMLIIAQPMTPTATGPNAKVKPGDVILQSDKEKTVLPVGEPTSFHIVFHYREWIEWADRNSGLGVLNRSKDPRGDLAKRWAKAFANRGGPAEIRRIGDKDVKVNIYEYHVFFIVGEGEREVQAMPLSRTAYKKGNQLISLARKRMGCPIWMGKYEARTVFEQNAKGSWYNWDFKTDGWASPEDKEFLKTAYEQAKAMYDSVALDFTSDETPEEAPAAPGAPQGEF